MSEDTADDPAPIPAPPMFRMHGEPLKLPPDFAAALAHVVVEWSRLEDAIESDLNWMMQFQVVADLAPEPPRAFNKKLELWRRAVNVLFAKIPQYRELAASVVARAKAAARVRNLLVHGTWPLDNPMPHGRFRVLNMTPVGGSRYRMDHVEANATDLEGLTADILDLAGLVMGLTMSRMLHAHHGLLTGWPARVSEDQVRQSPPTETKP